MPCTRPIDAWRGPNGAVAFVKHQGWVDKPLLIPCGQCMSCRLNKSRQWAMRIMHESSLYEHNAFLTLTYADEHLPTDASLVKEHHQLFMKRLRKKYAHKVRYYHCGEYGDELHRPHYHTILFNHHFADAKYYRTTETRSKLYTSETLDALWGHGHCQIGEVTFESAAYCARYVMKKLTGLRKAEYGSLTPEYSTMSRKPGIGAPWLALYKTDVFPLDACIINGKKVRVPRFYDNLLSDAESPLGQWSKDYTGFPIFMPSLTKSPMDQVRAKRTRNAAKHTENQTRERLDVIEELTQLRVDRLTRKLT